MGGERIRACSGEVYPPFLPVTRGLDPTGFTHLKKRLESRHLDDPRYWKCLAVVSPAITEKTRVFSSTAFARERCVHLVGLDPRVHLPPPQAGEGREGDGLPGQAGNDVDQMS